MAANKRNGPKLPPNISNVRKTLSSQLIQKCSGNLNEKKNIATKSKSASKIASRIPSSQTPVINNDVSKRKSAEKNTSLNIQNDQKKLTFCIRQKPNKNALKTSEDSKIQRLATMTRNIAKKELMSKMIITRNRLSQENISIQTIYSNSATNANTGKSRIPVRKQKNIVNAENVKN